MYIIIVGPAGHGKTAAANVGVSMLKEATNVYFASDRLTPEQLLEEMQAATHLTERDGEMFHQSPVFAYGPELSIFMGDQIKNTALLAILTRHYDAIEGEWDYSTKTRGTTIIDNGSIVLLGCTTPKWIEQIMSPIMIESGFTSRIIFVYDETLGKPSYRPKYCPYREILRDELIHDLGIISRLHGNMNFTETGDEYFEEWYDKRFYEPSMDDDRISGYSTRKRKEHMIKLAMILCVSMGNKLVLDKLHLMAADELLKAAEPTMSQAFGHSGRSPIAEDQAMILQYIDRHSLVKHTKILNTFQRHVDKEKLSRIIDTLQDMGRVFVYRAERRGGKDPSFGDEGLGAKFYVSLAEHERRIRNG